MVADVVVKVDNTVAIASIAKWWGTREFIPLLKRLFFVFADRHDHPWRKRLDPAEFNLGSGDRALVKGGKIHPLYRIMVPKEFVTAEADDGA